MPERHLTYEFPDKNPKTRLVELILHIADMSEGDPTYGKVKLAKILYFADFTAYRLYGEPITGTQYVKMEYGPIPADYLSLLQELQKQGQIVIRSQSYFEYEQQRVIAGRDADLTEFSGRDIALVDKIIHDFRGKNATEVSTLSHGMAWKIAELHKLIPYESAILSDEGITPDDVARAQELAGQYGWAE